MPQQFVQNPLEQFEQERLPVGWPWRFFAASFIVFLSSILIYVGMVFGYESFLNKKIVEQDQEINRLSASISSEDREQFSRFYSQLINLKSILDEHVFSSKVFPFLEKATNEKVYFLTANLKTAERELELDGAAANYQALAEQMESFKNSSLVEGLSLNQSQLASDNNVQFKMVLKLKVQALK